MQVTKMLAEFVHNTSLSDIPADVVEHSKLLVLDWLGVTLAGSKQEAGTVLTNYLKELGGKEQATVVGNGKTDVLNAALVNGTLSHALDLDDYHGPTLSHPTVAFLPAILAVAEFNKLSGPEVMNALILAFDVFVRVGYGAGRIHYDRGWHATATLGRFGAVAGVAKLLKLDVDTIVNAFGIAGTSTGGVRQVFGSMCKPFHGGKSSMDGIIAAYLAKNGFTSSKEIIEGPQGFYDIFTENADEGKAVADLGQKYYVPTVSFKPYPSCAFTHATIDLLRDLRKREKPDIEDIEQIVLEVNRGALDAAGKLEPKVGLEGKFSIYHCAAVALAEESVGFDKFTDEKVNEPGIVNLRRKIKGVPVEDSDIYLGSRITVRMKDGREYKEYTPLPKGDPGNPLVYDELAEKFRDVAGLALTSEKVETLVKEIRQLDKVTDISNIMTICMA